MRIGSFPFGLFVGSIITQNAKDVKSGAAVLQNRLTTGTIRAIIKDRKTAAKEDELYDA